jgi:predicted dehydrogenase
MNHLAIVGLGSIGRRHLRLAREIRPEWRITAVRTGTGEEVAEEYLANEVMYSLDQAIKAGIEAAVIASPATNHLEQAKKLLRGGGHILVEKPLSHKLEGLEEVLQLQHQAGTCRAGWLLPEI